MELSNFKGDRMVALKDKMKNHSPGRNGPGGRLAMTLAMVAMVMGSLPDVHAQNLINRGKITNTGTIRVKHQATGIDSLNGTFELFGSNQSVPAALYGNLTLSGSGVDTAAGNTTIANTLTIAPAVTLHVPSNAAYILGPANGKLVENGYLSGSIKKTVDLASVNPDTTFGGIGISIAWSGTNPGSTTVTRRSGVPVVVGGKMSIARYYDIQPTGSSLNGTLQFTYATGELGGSNPSTLDLWRSPDNGVTWRREQVARNGNTLTISNVRSFGRWTASDAGNLLGLAQYEWQPDSIRLIAGNEQRGRVKKLLDTAFVASIVDAYGQPISGQNVTFAVTQQPVGSVGDSLTTTVAITDSLGRVQTTLKLGSANGDYYVQASVPGVPSALATFHAIAKPAASILNALPLAIATDSVRSQVGPIAVKAMDSTGTVVQGVQVNFAVASAPDTAGAYQLTSTSLSTDTTGVASTNLKLGSKSGTYIVTASSPDVDPPVTRQFAVNATPGAIATVDYAGGGLDSVTALKLLSVRVLDSYGNPRSGDTVLFALTNKPSGSTLDSLFALTAVTDSNGYARTTLRVGQKSGNYVVTAGLKSQPQFATLFTTTAHNLVASSLTGATTTYADTIGAVLPPFAVSIADKYANPVIAANVAFAITQRPDTAAGGSITLSSVNTDSALGKASTVFTAGDRVGTYVVRASSGALAQNFTVQVSAGKPAQMLASGTLQVKPILQNADSALTVKLTDRKANPLANLPVKFQVVQKPLGAIGDRLSVTKSTTNALGVASTILTTGNKTGSYVIAAISDSLRGVVRSFTVNATNSAAYALDSVDGQYQRQSILSVLDTAFVVRVTDKGGNPVPGVLVNFALTSRPAGTSQDSVLKASDTTDASGIASTKLKLGTKVGMYVVTATSPVLPGYSRKFLANATYGNAVAIAKVRGDRQTAIPYTRLDSAFVVNIRDAGSNPIPGISVRFRITQVPLPETVGQTLSDTVAVTDSLGDASTRLTLGSEVGLYAVTASVNGVPTVTFNTTVFLLVGDANIDAAVNVGDLTAIIDHIIGKRTLTGSDSAAADINSDGVIDIRDAILMRDRVLTGNWSQHVTDSLFALARPTSVKQSKSGTAVSIRSVADTAGNDLVAVGSDLEATQNGMRLNLTNNVPIKGLQYVIRMNNPPMIQKPDVIYERANMMTVLVFRTDTTLRIVAYNLDNTPIQPGSGAIFRLPIPQTKVADIDTAASELITSEGFDNRALVMPFLTIKMAAPGAYPTTYRLEQNYPNPFNGTTIIYYEVPDVAGKLAHVTLQVFNILGQKVKTLVKIDQEPGRYFAVWDGSNDAGQKVSSGVYIYRLVWKDNQIAKKMLMIK